ncbi:MAG: hypothetical protein LBN12_04820 [Clostridiales Family XIII bacterium]|nr:hypothetical protein [Clostridiales Family XIII bacterium]
MSERREFTYFVSRFFERFSPEELDQDIAAAADVTPETIEEAKRCFAGGKNLRKYQEAALSVRLGGISTRTIRNWKNGENVYSERSSKILNHYFDRHLPKGIRADRRKLAWLWLAFRLKMDDVETDLFLSDCMGGRRIYALDLYEIVLRTAIRLNSRLKRQVWDFFDALCFADELHAEVTLDAALTETYRVRVLEVIDASDGAVRAVCTALSLIYEEALKESNAADVSPREVNATQLIEDSWTDDFSEPAPPDLSENTVPEVKARLTAWAGGHRLLFRRAYLSWFLTVLGCLITYSASSAKHGFTGNLFKDWYFDHAKALSGEHRIPNFPENVSQMAVAYEYAEGEPFEKFARMKCRVYFDRMFDAPLRISRQRLLEYYLIAQRCRVDEAALNELLERHYFRPLDPGETPKVTEKLFLFKY